jgi:nitroreductase
MEFDEIVRRQRIVRQFERRPVPHEVLRRIAVAAQRAPTAGFSQGQRLIVVTDEATRRRVGEAVEEWFEVAEGHGDWISGCAAQFVPCVSEKIYRDRYGEPDKRAEDARMGHATDAEDWPVPYWWMDIGCTTMLVMLAAINEGLAAGFCGVPKGPAPLQAVLGIPEDMVPVGVIPVGYRLADKRSPSLKRGRVPFEEFARWESWSGAP